MYQDEAVYPSDPFPGLLTELLKRRDDKPQRQAHRFPVGEAQVSARPSLIRRRNANA